MSVNDETLRLAKSLKIQVAADVDQTTRGIVRAWARAWDEIRDTWATAMMDLAADSVNGAWPAPHVVMRSQRAQAALLAATDQIIDLANFTGVTVLDGVGRVVAATDPLVLEMLASQLPATVDRAALGIAFNRLDTGALSAIVERTREQITAATFRLEAGAQEAMRRELIRGIAVGDNPRRAAARMVKRVEGAFNGGLTRALTIARTEMLDAHRAAARGAEVANADLVVGWQWQATLDVRTCSSCLAQHGRIHTLEEPGPLDHHQGRCARLPVLKPWRELGIDLDEPASTLPDAREWFDGLPEADQVQILGRDRLDLLNAGYIGWDDLSQVRVTPGWRDAYHPTPVRDLKVIAGVA